MKSVCPAALSIILVAAFAFGADAIIPVQLAMGGNGGPRAIPPTKKRLTAPASPPPRGAAPDGGKALADAINRLTPKQQKQLAKAMKKLTPEERAQLIDGLKRQFAAQAAQGVKRAR